jgi:hypothetical protein
MAWAVGVSLADLKQYSTFVFYIQNHLCIVKASFEMSGKVGSSFMGISDFTSKAKD